MLHAAVLTLGVSLEALLAAPRATGRQFPKATLPLRTRGDVRVRKLLPDPVPGMEMEVLGAATRRPHDGRAAYRRDPRIPHLPARPRRAGGERRSVPAPKAGDVVAFRGDQRRSYPNPDSGLAVGFSVMVLVSPLAVS